MTLFLYHSVIGVWLIIESRNDNMWKKGKRKVQGVLQSQAAAHSRHQEEEETDKAKQAQTEQTHEKHQDQLSLL